MLDASGGAAVSCLGHQHPRVIEAMAQQASKLAYAHTAFFSSEPAEALAERLVGHEPGGLAYAYFVSGGSEAIEASIKLARQYFIESGEPQRQHFIARRQSYHGNTLGALAAGGNAWRRAPYAPLLSGAFSHVTPAFAYHEKRDDESEAEFVARLAAELEAEFQRLGPDTVAAFIAEPVVGATAGCVPAPDGYFQAVREICDRHGALLILDEVMCGMGRTGTLHAWEQEGIAPDIQAIAKGLGGGYQPIGAMLASGRIIDTIRAGLRRVPARPHLSGASPRLRRRARGAADHRRGASARPGQGARPPARAAADRALRQSPPCRRHQGPRPVLGDRARRRSRQPRAVRSRAEAATRRSRRPPSTAGSAAIRPAAPSTAAAATTCCWRRPISRQPDEIDMIVDRLGHAVDTSLKSVGH